MTRLCYVFVLLTLFLLMGCTPPPLQAERAVERGNEALLEGDLISAERHYREALTFEPLPPTAANARNSVVHNNLGNAFYRQALWQDAQSAYEQALTTADRQQQAIHHYNLGNVFMQQVRSQAQSVQQLNQPQNAQTTPQDPQDEVSPEQLTAAAIANYQDALRRNPDDEDAKYNLELALQQNAQQNQQQNQQQDDQEEQQEEQQDENEGDNEGDNEDEQEDEQEEQDEQEDGEQDEEQESEQDEGQPEPPEPGDDEEQPAAPPPLTQAQALQLLEAAAEQSDTLQEYLQRMMAPLPPPEQDW